MKNRIKQIRKENKLTQVEFGEKIGTKGNTITNYETGLRTPTDAVIHSICREFNVDETWLRTGEGEMFKKRTRNQEIMAFANSVMEGLDESFKKRLLLALSKLNESDWETLEKISNELNKED